MANRSVLEHKSELEALLPAFGSTNGSYLLAEDEGNRATHIRENLLLIIGSKEWEAAVSATVEIIFTVGGSNN